MRTRLYILASLAAAAVLTGCAQAPAPVAPDTREADAKAIRELESTWNKEWAAKDTDKILSHYAEDAKLMMPNVPVLDSSAARATVLKQFLSDPNGALNFTSSTVEVSKSGDVAYAQGTYSMTSTDEKTKKPVTEKGKYVTVYRKGADGSWKAVEDINNADAPAAPAVK